jgi:ribonuclease P protein component
LLPKSSSIRLSGKNAFDLAFAGNRVATPDLVFYYRPNGTALGHLGLVIGRKAFAGAVTRNRLKRRLRELFRRHLGVARGFDVVVVAKRGRPEPEFAILERQMKKLAGALEGK